MQKRLSVARALLADPSVLLFDEATHDLDPRGSSEIVDLTRTLASEGAAVIWTTQRIDEVRGFADAVTLLTRGRVRFSGAVPALLAHATPSRYLLHVRNGSEGGGLERALNEAVDQIATVSGASGSPEHYFLALREGAVLGEAISRLTRSDFDVLTCTEARSGLEEAFLELTKDERA
jgi:ABC-2 type transport system ATP-binding protein